MCCETLEYPDLDEALIPTNTILIVDDDTDQTEILSRCLSRQGFVTHVANTLHEGHSLAKRHRPDLILLDVDLPDGSGIEMCAELDDSPMFTNTPVIVISGMDSPNLVRQSRAAGGKYFVHKPYDPNALLVLIEQQLSESDQESW